MSWWQLLALAATIGLAGFVAGSAAMLRRERGRSSALVAELARR